MKNAFAIILVAVMLISAALTVFALGADESEYSNFAVVTSADNNDNVITSCADTLKTDDEEEVTEQTAETTAAVVITETAEEIEESEEEIENTEIEITEESKEETIAAAEEETAVAAEEITKTAEESAETSCKRVPDAGKCEEVSNEMINRGSYGRVVIPDADVDTAIFYTTDYTTLQAVVDADDSACLFDFTDTVRMLADHCEQGFGGLRFISGDVKAYIVKGQEVETYTLVEKISDAYNCGSYISYNNGEIVNFSDNDFIIYTCNNDAAGTITVTIWTLA